MRQERSIVGMGKKRNCEGRSLERKAVECSSLFVPFVTSTGKYSYAVVTSAIESSPVLIAANVVDCLALLHLDNSLVLYFSCTR